METHPSLDLASFSHKKVLNFYFSPTCPHCQEATPQVQAFAGEIKVHGYESIVVSVQRITVAEIRDFNTQYICRLLVFWDAERRFGETYAPRSLPTQFPVKSSGAYFREDKYCGVTTLEELRKVL